MLPGVYQAKKKTTPYIFEVRLPTAENISALAALTRKKWRTKLTFTPADCSRERK